MSHSPRSDATSTFDRIVGLPEWLPREFWLEMLERYERWIAQGCGYGTIHLTFANGIVVGVRGEEDAHIRGRRQIALDPQTEM